MTAATMRSSLPALAAACLLATAATASATTYNVNSVAGLINAVAAANATLGPDEIDMAPGTYTLDATHPQFPVTDDLAVIGGGRPGTVIVGFYPGLQVFDVHQSFGADPPNPNIHATFTNLAIEGPGIALSTGASGRLLVQGCTISGSGAEAIYSAGGPTYIVNSTMSGMRRGVYLEGDSLTLDHDTITGSTLAGLECYGGPVTVRNTIFAYNATDVASTPTAADHDIDTDGTGGAGFTTVDPLLGALADNGGPTPTFALPAGSAAIDAGAAGEPTDQRGVPRPQGAAPDIGAFERTALPFSTVSASLPPGGTITTDPTSGGATPANPVQSSLTAPGGSTVTIDQGPGAADFGFLGQTVQITASPEATPANPFVITFTLDASVIPAGQSASTIEVDKNSVAIPPCGGAAGEASPDPCVSSRVALAGGDAQITVLTSTASTWQFAPGTTTAVGPDALSLAFAIGPSPLRGTARVRLSLPAAAEVDLALFDVTGRRTATLVTGRVGAGLHEFDWSAQRLPAGLYFARLRVGADVRTATVVRLN